jgi:flagellar hook-associated protein 2
VALRLLEARAEEAMGTVGLNFGAATSGTGFDVSSTVAEIVGNLQNVEKPWNSQLTKLDSQDTAISSLGTLFSSLSNDMSTLTDAEGILAEKTGSSSDTNVLTLTSADSSAAAGTYTVEVGNLATTSSGYLAKIANASDPLSGSITLQAGSGTQLSITLNSSNNTLAGLASTINSADIGIHASVLTDSSGSMLSLVSATPGTAGDIVVSSSANTLTATDTAALSYTAATNGESGNLAALANTTDTLSGSLKVQVGNGTAQTIVVGAQPSGGAALNTIYTGSASGWNTLTGLETAINTASLGVSASIVTSSGGAQSLSLTSNPAANLTITSSINDVTGTTPLTYTSPVSGKDASITVDGVGLTSASNTVSDLIPGVTFQLLAPSSSGEQVQVVIGNDNTDVESTVGQFVSDYNSLISAMNTQEGDDSSGNAEPLFGSPTLTLLQQQLLSGLNLASPNGYLTAVTANTDTTVSGSMTISVGSGAAQNIIVGSGTSGNGTIYTGSESGWNTLTGVASAINAANIGVTANVVTIDGESSLTFVSQTAGSSGAVSVASKIVATSDTPVSFQATQSSGGTLSGIGSPSDTLSGTFNMSLGDGQSVLPITLSAASSNNTLTGLRDYINNSNFGVTATVVSSGNGSNTTYGLSVVSDSASNSLTVASAISDLAPGSSALTFTPTQNSGGTFSTVASGSDVLSGSVTIQVGSGAGQIFSPPFTSAATTENTIAGLASAINAANIGVTASVVTIDGQSTLSLLSGTSGAAGDLTVSSNLLDATNTNASSLSYTNSSDVNSLTSLGISVNNDGSLTFDATSLDSVLNSDYSGVVGFFQNANSWGMSFSTMLTNAGSSSPTGVLALAGKSDSNIESTLNADISKENSLISAQQISLTAELNSANQIMQELPSQLEGVNELYSAITGYNQNTGG